MVTRNRWRGHNIEKQPARPPAGVYLDAAGQAPAGRRPVAGRPPVKFYDFLDAGRPPLKFNAELNFTGGR